MNLTNLTDYFMNLTDYVNNMIVERMICCYVDVYYVCMYVNRAQPEPHNSLSIAQAHFGPYFCTRTKGGPFRGPAHSS